MTEKQLQDIRKRAELMKDACTYDDVILLLAEVDKLRQEIIQASIEKIIAKEL